MAVTDTSGNAAANFSNHSTTNSSTVNPSPKGVCIAFTDGSFVENPVWTRIDDPAGINVVSSWSVDRGRSSELDKTKTGTASVEIVDTQGVLDPTNSTSPVLGLGAGASVDPMRQIAVCLKHPTTGVWFTEFRGFIDEISLSLDEATNVFTGSVECVDAFGPLASIEVIPNNGLAAGSGGTGARVGAPTDSAGDVFYEDGSVDDRVRAALADAGWPSGLSVVFSGNVDVQETVYAVRSTILQILQDATDAEFPGVSNVFVDRKGRVVFHGRLARFDPSGVAADAGVDAWDYNQWLVASDWGSHVGTVPIKKLTLARGMSFLFNAVLATPQKILDPDVAGQLSTDPGSITEFKVRSLSFENLLTEQGKDDGLNANEETKLFADFYAANYHDPRTRISSIGFRNVYRGHPREGVLWDMFCQADISDTMDVVTVHPGGGGFNETFFIEGVRLKADKLGGDDYQLVDAEYDLSPTAYFTSNPFS